jgi:hypothetical protein
LKQKLCLVPDNTKFDVIYFNNGMRGWQHTEAEYHSGFPQFPATIKSHAIGPAGRRLCVVALHDLWGEHPMVVARSLKQTVLYMKLKQPASLPTLLKGQLWKTRTARVEIMNMGKLLAHYRYFTGDQTRVPTTMAPVGEVQKHLMANGGKLVRNDRLKDPA